MRFLRAAFRNLAMFSYQFPEDLAQLGVVEVQYHTCPPHLAVGGRLLGHIDHCRTRFERTKTNK